MADRLILHDLAVQSRVGAYDWEREKPQTIWIDVELEIDAAKAAATDRLEHALDYAKLAESIRAHLADKTFFLIETIAHELADLVLWESRCAKIKLRVRKKALKDLGYAAVEVERSR